MTAIFHAELGRTDDVFDEIRVEFKGSVFKALDDFLPLPEGVAHGFGDIACREVLGARFGEDAVELFGDGATAGAADEFTADCRGTCLAGLFFDVVDALDVKQDGQSDFGRSIS